jgi:hypothetical protein
MVCGSLVLACEIWFSTRHLPLTPNLELIGKMIWGQNYYWDFEQEQTEPTE